MVWAEGARIGFNLCFVKVIMRDYRFASMAEISRLRGAAFDSFMPYFLGRRWGCGRPPSDTLQLFLILEPFKGKALLRFVLSSAIGVCSVSFG